ncbi:unnamed protein product [Prorocentrum cordatum]|uniref:Uncharacterized protein n=1 Tax=Prorocentrum cordatum TaxID=2364126 RepID=A0ABN9XXR3_9DINO|nr:unnamed protein product [Polarella glacialis]
MGALSVLAAPILECTGVRQRLRIDESAPIQRRLASISFGACRFAGASKIAWEAPMSCHRNLSGRKTCPHPRPRGLGPWTATPRIRGVSSRTPRAERIRATAYPRERARESRPEGADTETFAACEVSDAICYMLLAATDLAKTDRLPSLEVVALWQSLPPERNPLPGRADAELQGLMKEHWKTLCGSLIAELLSMPWAFRLFGGASAQDEAASAAMLADRPRGAPAPAMLTNGGEARGRSQSVPPSRGAQDGGDRTLARARASSVGSRGSNGRGADQTPSGIAGLLAHVKEQFDKNRFSNSGLAGPFRESSQGHFRSSYLAAVQAIDELMYLLGVVLVHFQRISEGLGDYGMIRVAPWLHPILEALAGKVQTLKGCLEAVNKAVDQELVIAKARGRKVKAPAPTDRQSARAHASIERAVTGRDSHVSALLQLLEDLKARSAPERLPALMDNLGDACQQLEGVLSSQQFRLCVGDKFPDLPSLQNGQVLAPPLGDGARPPRPPAAIASSQVQIEEVA